MAWLNDVWQWTLEFPFNGLLGLCLYWLPLSLCLYGYTVRSWQKVRQDLEYRANHTYYSPSITVGTLLGYAFVTVCPYVNSIAAVFDVGPDVFNSFFKWLGRVFDFPLVPDTAAHKAKRKS